MFVDHRFVPAALLALAACEPAAGPTEAPAPDFHSGNGIQNSLVGGYTANVAAAGVIIGQFSISAHVDRDGNAGGHFSFVAEFPDGTGTLDFDADVICMPVNEALGRAWVGAIITRNRSTRPSHQGDIHQPGQHIWFRVADRSAGGSGEADRTTSVGFKGAAGIQTSQDYCAAQIWPNEGAGLLTGNLTVH